MLKGWREGSGGERGKKFEEEEEASCNANL